MLWGGYLREIPKPHKRKWPESREKRTVNISCSIYSGIGKHYYVSILEEDNPIWNAKREVWQKAWDDKKGKGKSFGTRSFDSHRQAMDHIRKILAENFSPETHWFYENSTGETWFYREGD